VLRGGDGVQAQRHGGLDHDAAQHPMAKEQRVEPPHRQGGEARKDGGARLHIHEITNFVSGLSDAEVALTLITPRWYI